MASRLFPSRMTYFIQGTKRTSQFFRNDTAFQNQVRKLSSTPSIVNVAFDKCGAAVLTIPLQDGEKRRFVLRNDSTTLAAFAEGLQKEGVASDAIAVRSAEDGVPFALHSTSAWHVLAHQPIQLVFNGTTYNVQLDGQPPAQALDTAAVNSLPDVESNLSRRAEEIRKELEPLDSKVQLMLQSSHRRTRAIAWLGLAYMSAQFGFLARLTWWDYSWDIMEPVTYFVTYGTGIFFYAYYVVTRQEANFAAMFDRQQLITAHKRIAKAKFDLVKYNQLRDDLHEIERQLTTLRQSPDWQVLNCRNKTNVSAQ